MVKHMSRIGYLIAIAVLIAALAAGVLVWQNYFDTPPQVATTNAGSTVSDQSPKPSTKPLSDADAKWFEMMRQIPTDGGFSATFAKKDLGNWVLAAGHKLERYSLGGDEAAMGRLTSTEVLNPENTDWRASTLSFTLPMEFSRLSNGKKIEVGIVARTAMANGSPALYTVYATQEAGNSGWKAIQLTGDFQLVKFVYQVPELPAGYKNNPLIAFHSDAKGEGRSIELLGAYVRLAQEQ
jgi:hypothetical protein